MKIKIIAFFFSMLFLFFSFPMNPAMATEFEDFVPAKVAGYQWGSEIETDLRIVGLVRGLAYEEVGFHVTWKNANRTEQLLSTTQAMERICAEDNACRPIQTSAFSVTGESGYYFYSAVLKGIDMNEYDEITVTPYSVELGKKVRDWGESKQIIVGTPPQQGEKEEENPAEPPNSQPTEPQYYSPISIMTFNIKGDVHDVGDKIPVVDKSVKSDLSARRKGIGLTIALKNPDVVCLNECENAQLIKDNYTGSVNYTVYQQTGATKSNAILYNSDKFTELDKGMYELGVESGTWSNGSSASYARGLVWVKLKRKSDGAVFVIVSTHLPVWVREYGYSFTEKMLDYFDTKFSGTPLFVMGDFNCYSVNKILDPGFTDRCSLVYRGYTDVKTIVTDKSQVSKATFPKDGRILDYIYGKTGTFRTEKYSIIDTKVTWQASYSTVTATPSDHFPVYCEVSIKK